MLVKVVVQKPRTFVENLADGHVARPSRAASFELIVRDESRYEVSKELSKLTP